MKIARINVKTEAVKYEEITRESKYFLLGARGLSSQIVHDEVPLSLFEITGDFYSNL